MDLKQIQFVKTLALYALFSDDMLMNRLVLKGGSVLDLIYGIAARSSIDLDFSMADDFGNEELENVKAQIITAIETTFRQNDYVAIDIKFTERPKRKSAAKLDFWGGYRIEFKVLAKNDFDKLEDNLGIASQKAFELGAGHRKAFRIDISKFEYCDNKKVREVEGYTIYIYSPEMIIFEKLRAICQQMPEYSSIVDTLTRSARARDFYDIHSVMSNIRVNLTDSRNIEILRRIFAVKRVPLNMIGMIPNFREFHRPDFESVRDTLVLIPEVRDFDYYFDFVVENCVRALEPFWVE